MILLLLTPVGGDAVVVQERVVHVKEEDHPGRYGQWISLPVESCPTAARSTSRAARELGRASPHGPSGSCFADPRVERGARRRRRSGCGSRAGVSDRAHSPGAYRGSEGSSLRTARQPGCPGSECPLRRRPRTPGRPRPRSAPRLPGGQFPALCPHRRRGWGLGLSKTCVSRTRMGRPSTASFVKHPALRR
jgi:hypothetical protein